MARCRLTRMSLHNIRKDKQYQCIVIDFVRTGVIAKSKAEELLGYTIPGGLLQGSVADPDSGSGSSGTGDSGSGSSGTGDSGNTGTGESGSGSSGTGSSGTGDSGNTDPTPVATIPVTIKLGTGYDDSGFVLDKEEYLSGSDGNNFVVEVPITKTWNEALAMLADAVDAKINERAAADSSWSWAGYRIEGSDTPFYAIPDFQGSPNEWQFRRSPDEEVLYNSNVGGYNVALSELDAETLASLEQGFNMLFIITADNSSWYHNADWFAAL